LVVCNHSNGTYTFTPRDNFSGDVQLSYSVNDGTESTTGSIKLTVDAVDDVTTITRVV
jgi:hypothetical protein